MHYETQRRARRAFTLIELLIVVAIIAILAAIAVPNFLEAQVRSKVSRAQADMRSMTTALEAYYVDNNRYPDTDRTLISPPIKLGLPYSRATLVKLSTPIAYITTGLLSDPFAIGVEDTTFFGYANTLALETVDLGAVGAGAAVPRRAGLDAHRYVLQSVGPDQYNYAINPDTDPNQGFALAVEFLIDPAQGIGNNFIYDPTNGTVSTGDIVRTAKFTGG